MNIVFLAIALVVVALGVEYISRGAPQPVRWGLLLLVAVLLVWWLAHVLGVGV